MYANDGRIVYNVIMYIYLYAVHPGDFCWVEILISMRRYSKTVFTLYIRTAIDRFLRRITNAHRVSTW